MTQKFIHSDFLRNCEVFKSNVALISDSESVTYPALADKAFAISGSILSHINNNKYNKPIVIFLEKALPQIFAVLGVSISGHSFVPININWPKFRIQSIISKIDPDIIITNIDSVKKTFNDFDLLYQSKILFLEDIFQSNIESKFENNFEKTDDLAYIIFTSGTTGEPKGVAITHCSAINTIDDINSKFNVNQNDSVFALSDLTFDLSIYDIFGLLSCGGSVLIPNSEQIKDPAYWIKLLSQQRVTIWNSAPMFMQMLVSYIENVNSEELIKNVEKISDNLRLVMLSGDKIPIKLPQKIKSIFKNASVVSLGGATEASIWSIIFPIEEINPNWASIPYGKALKNQSIHILDENMKKMNVGEIGEIYIGGIGLAECYYGDNKLTQVKFKQHEDFGRIYATGDLGRLMKDGNIEILGRKDNQIKLNGYRIELSEIEKVFLDQFNVKNIHLLKHKYDTNVEILLAFLVGYTDTFSVNDIKLHLKNFIPSYSIPSRILFIDAIPVTENGKVDDNTLKELANKEEISNNSNQQELNEVHKKIFAIIATSLDKPKINPNLDFYDVGGNSLAAVKICADIFSNFNITIPSTMIFNTKTIAEFSEIVSRKLNNL